MTINALMMIFLLMQLKHFVFDFITQTKYQWSNKGKYLHGGGILHAGLHALGTFWVLFLFADLEVVCWLALLDFVVHYHVDWLKMNLNDRWKLGPTTSEKYWWLLGADQLLHQLTYVAIIWFAATL